MRKPTIVQSRPAVIRSNGIELVYDTFGSRKFPPVILIMGFSMQMIGWDPEFCRQLASYGYRVIRFDNRDIGLSHKCASAGVPNLPKLLLSRLRGKPVRVPYTLEVMAQDTFGLMDALSLQSAHIVGASMGGMIGQIMAIQCPERLLSLTCLMSASGEMPDLKNLRNYALQHLTAMLPFQKRKRFPAPRPQVLKYLLSPSPKERDLYIEHGIKVSQAINGSDLQFDVVRARQRAAEAFDRGLCPEGSARQLAAVLLSASRLPDLPSLRMPVLIIHGKSDPLIPPQASITLANAIPGSTLKLIENMGHGLPPQVWPPILETLRAHLTGRTE